ncbi:MAG: hypothetical protein JW797_13960 [Bradymonadales bacterium]|nr:hypothetical protein [Bradymonadales bacterium]
MSRMKRLGWLVMGFCLWSGCIEDTTEVTETGYVPEDITKKFVDWAALAGESATELENECLADLEEWHDEAGRAGCRTAATTGEGTIWRRQDDSSNYQAATFSFFYGGHTGDECGWIGSDILWNNGGDDLLVGLAGADTGHFIDLGDEIPFDQITWDSITEDDLGLTEADVDALLYHYSQRTPQVIRDQMPLAGNHRYLLRVWHGEYEVFLKLLVTDYQPGVQATFQWEVLHERSIEELCGRYADAYGYWLINEKGRDEGSVTLYDRSTWGDYVKATLNAQQATRDNVFMTLNTWDVIFEGTLQGFDWRDSDEVASNETIADMGAVELETVGRDDADSLDFENEVVPQVGHTYYIRSHVYGRDAELALTVTDYQQGDLVTFEWRELYLAGSTY